MHRLVLAPPVEVVAVGFDDHQAERALLFDVERLVDDRIADFIALRLDRGDQRDQTGLVRVENLLDAAGGHAALVLVEQRVVGMLRVAQMLRRLALEFE